jgi:phosphorylcholine metabolism protein LicD
MKYEAFKKLAQQTSIDQALVQKPQELSNEITKPKHYNAAGIEVITVLETYAIQYPKEIIPHMSNVLKYTCRAPYKGALLSDLKKARAYLTRAITTLEGDPRWE